MDHLKTSRRLVLKIGSSLIVNCNGKINIKWLNAFCDDVATCCSREQEIIIVTSGAVAIGRNYLGLESKQLCLEEKQASAAIGQICLAHAYQEAMVSHSLNVAQLLITLEDTENRRLYLNVRNTIKTLLRFGTIPVINENDTVATQEIRFGDNDRLAAKIAQMICADILILFSDVDGLYSTNPQNDSSAKFIAEVTKLTPDIEAMAGNSSNTFSSGGMITKLQAARIALASGCHMAITSGKHLHPLKKMESGGRCTWFYSSEEPLSARKLWIASSIKPNGMLKIDEGAKQALIKDGSLLPIGVIAIVGDFKKGDAVIVIDNAENRIGIGLSAYSANDAKLIIGHKSSDFERMLGYRGSDEIIHRDDLVIEL
ncbi:MAG: glutamate 5-kinase [Rhodospirillaceae bacterium]|jgi:glutamate 5-kinase|nr:glutamate 5-kinase [Rhodospirillaceae bacterium]